MRAQKFLLVAVLSISTVLMLIFLLQGRPTSQHRLQLVRSRPPRWLKGSSSIDVEPTGFVVDTPSCRIPDFDAFNPIISPYVRDPDPRFAVCNHSQPVTFTDRQYIRLNTTLGDSLGVQHCVYQQVIRYDDNESSYGDAVRFTGDVEVTDAEFVRVRCYSNSSDRPFYTDFHAVARLKPDVEHRCDEAMKQRRRTDDVFDVLMVGIDSTSRLNSIRRLNSTRQFLLQQLHAVEMYGYSRVGDNTYPNVMALLTGQLAEERPFGAIDLTPFLWKDFSENGYRTLQVEDSFIENHVFNVKMDEMNSPGGFRSSPTDYYFRPLIVAMHADHSLLDWRPKESRMCTGPKLEDELIFNWVRDVMQLAAANSSSKFGRRPIFAFAFFSALTHDNMNEAAHMDVILERFFRSLHDSGHLRITAVVLFSDHGLRFGLSRGNTRMGWYEENLPMFLIAMPASFRRRHVKMMESLRSNQHRLTTPFDVHETVRRLLDVSSPYNDSRRIERGRRGVSLFDVTLDDRTCKDATIAPTYCECELSRSRSVDVTTSEVQRVARATVEYINTQLMVYKNLCAKLQLEAVLNAGMTDRTTAITVEKHVYYTLTFRTRPGNAVFQAAVEWLGVNVRTQSDILRLNSYKEQAGCVQHIVHKKWCYCVVTR